MGFFGRIFGSKEAKVGAAIGAIVAAGEVGENAAHAMPPQESSGSNVERVEKSTSPEAIFKIAKQTALSELNETTTDEGSFGEKSGKNWKAVLKNQDGALLLEVQVEQEGKTVTQRFELTKTEQKDGEKEYKYSFSTGMDFDEQRRLQEAQDTLAAALGKGKKKGGSASSGPIAMNDGE